MSAPLFGQTRRPAGASVVEVALIGLLGLSLPFTNFPFFVWRGFGVDLAHVTGGALLVVVLARWISKGFPPALRTILVPGAVAAVILVVPVVAVRLPGFDAQEFWRAALHLAFFLAILVAIAFSGLSRGQVLALLAVLAVEAVLVAVYALYQAVALPKEWPSGVEFLNRFARTPLRAQGLVWRATATFEEPKWLTIYLLPAIAYLYRCALRAFRRGRNATAAACFLGIAVVDAAVVATASLGGIPAAAILTAVCAADFFVRARTARTRWVLAGGGILLLLAALAFAGTGSRFVRYLGDRVAAERGETIQSEYSSDYPSGHRYVANARYGVSIFRESPLVGAGLGQFGPVGGVRGVELGFPAELTRDGPWIGLTGLPAEAGVLGTAALLWLVYRVLGGRTLTHPAEAAEPRDDRATAWLIVVAVVLKEVYSGLYVHLWTWFPLAMAAALVRSSSAEPAPVREEAVA